MWFNYSEWNNDEQHTLYIKQRFVKRKNDCPVLNLYVEILVTLKFDETLLELNAIFSQCKTIYSQLSFGYFLTIWFIRVFRSFFFPLFFWHKFWLHDEKHLKFVGIVRLFFQFFIYLNTFLSKKLLQFQMVFTHDCFYRKTSGLDSSLEGFEDYCCYEESCDHFFYSVLYSEKIFKFYRSI